MNMFLYIAIGIFVVAFVVLVVYAIMTLKSYKDMEKNVSKTLDELQIQMEGITSETTSLLKKANNLVDNVDNKSAKLDSLFDGIKGIGMTIQSFNDTLKKLSSSINASSANDNENASQVVKWGTVLMDLWQKNKK
ncbi:MAG TPA: DUF948 domain-containing protein [Candidatus Avamphibacillus sp.]|nr:DUF948 domain-containing protein [Candidatus Avamphibacillus sp.]